MAIAIAFARMPVTDSPNIRAVSDEKALHSYLKAMTACFASLRRWNPSAELLCVVDEPLPEPYVTILRTMNVGEITCPFEHRPPLGLARTFNASFYMLDAMRSVGELATSLTSAIVFVDPDVLCVRSLDHMIAAAGDGVGAYALPYGVNDDINGLTRQEAAVLSAVLDGTGVEASPHYGGELFVFSAADLTLILDRCERAFSLAIARFTEGLSRYTTEEHLLSYALRNTQIVDLSPYVRRIWTTRRYRNVRGDEHDLALWHVPAEKGRGFSKLYSAACDRTSWFWTWEEERFRKKAARMLQVERSPGRALTDHSAHALLAAQRLRRSIRLRGARPSDGLS